MAQEVHQPTVLLDGKHFACFREQQFSQWPQPWTDFQDPVGRHQLCCRHDPPQLIAIVQEILAERFAQADFALRQDLFHHREFHRQQDATVGRAWIRPLEKWNRQVFTLTLHKMLMPPHP